jgi:DNA recombination protein RmuC
MSETTTLSNALRRSDTRGRWGELQLRRILEMLNMNEGTDFHEQKQELGEGTGRPDFTIYLPGERVLYLDSKAPMSAYLDGLEETDPAKRTEKFTTHARAIKDHVTALKRRNYTDGENSLNYVVMFIPTESSLAAACEINPKLIEDAAKDQVILASPTALIALLNNISLLWQQEKQAKNSAEIIRQASELHGRLTVFIRHFGALGTLLNRTVEAFNKSVGSFDDRVMPAARKVAALGDFDGDIETIPTIDVNARDSRNAPSIEAVPDSDAS